MAKKKTNEKPIWNGPIGSMMGKYEMPSEEELRSNGYMTIDEFMNKFEVGMRQYLHNNWRSDKEDDVHHPEDLASNALCYAEAVWETIQVFGAGNTNEK